MGTAFAATAAALAVSAAIAGETPAPRQTKGIAFEAPGHAVAEGVPVVARGGDPGATWVLLDWRGRQTGIVGVFDSGGESRLPPLPAGYYRLGNATLAVVAPQRSAVGGAVSDTTFFALDSAQSWLAAKGQFKCPWNEGDTFRTVSDLIALAGIRHVRERMAWAGVHRDPDNPDYGKYMVNADLLRERGIHVSGLFADAPKCTVPKTGKIPSNLAAVFDGCARLATDFSNRMEDWEFWNEPDSGIAPPWDYAAALKAAYLGFKAGCPDIAVLPASHCAGPDTAWARVLYDNDAAKFGDAFNYHTYARPSGYPALFARMREFLGCYGISDRAIWVTEAGTELEGPARSSGAMEGMKAHSPGQELVVAEFYPKSQIGLMMEGVARNYFFVFCPYNERDGGKDWGAMRRDGTVKPVYAAMATMTREIGDAGLVGEIKVGDGVKAYLFERTDGSQTIAFWSVSPLDAADGGIVSPEPDFARTVRLEVSAAAAETSPVILSDLCGMRSTMTAAGGVLELAATRFPAYASGLRGLVADIPARPAGKVSPYEPEAGEDLSVVLRVELDESGFALENSKTVARLLGDSGRVKVQVWNLGDCAKTGRVEVAGVRLSGIPETVIVGPRGTLPAEFECHIEPLNDSSAYPTFVLQGVFGGRHSSRLAVPLLLPERLFAGCTVEPLAWSNSANWTRNDSAASSVSAWDEEEQALRFDFSWNDPGVPRWFYPVYALSQDESLDCAVAIQFEMKSEQDKAENDFAWCYCMLLPGGPERYAEYPPPIRSWEKRIAFLRDDGSLSDVRSFRLGVNPKGMKCTLWVRNVEVVRAKSASEAIQP